MIQVKLSLAFVLGVGAVRGLSAGQVIINTAWSSFELDVTERVAIRDEETWFVFVEGKRETGFADGPAYYQAWIRLSAAKTLEASAPDEAFLIVGSPLEYCVLKGQVRHGVAMLHDGPGGVSVDVDLVFRMVDSLASDLEVPDIELRVEQLDALQAEDLIRHLDGPALKCVPELRDWKSRLVAH